MFVCGHGGMSADLRLVPRRGLEPPRFYPLVPETSASTNSATRARARMLRRDARDVNARRANPKGIRAPAIALIGPVQSPSTYTSARCQKPPRRILALAPRAPPMALPLNPPSPALARAMPRRPNRTRPPERPHRLLRPSRRSRALKPSQEQAPASPRANTPRRRPGCPTVSLRQLPRNRLRANPPITALPPRIRMQPAKPRVTPIRFRAARRS